MVALQKIFSLINGSFSAKQFDLLGADRGRLSTPLWNG
jgi:hypothetical protein